MCRASTTALGPAAWPFPCSVRDVMSVRVQRTNPVRRTNRARHARACLIGSATLLALIGFGEAAGAQVALPEVVVRGTKPKPAKPQAVAHRHAPTTPATPAEKLAAKSNAFDAARSNLYTTTGTSADVITHATIDALPGGDNQTVEKILLQAPG